MYPHERANANPWYMCVRVERGPLRGVTASAPTEQHNIHTLKLAERVSVRERGEREEERKKQWKG